MTIAEQLADAQVRLLRVPFPTARGGSGATGVEVVHVTVTGGDGADGSGFTYALTGGGSAVATMLTDTLLPAATGTDLTSWPRTWQRLADLGHRLGRGAVLPALSALDIAVWDLRARAASLPLHRFLGSHHDGVQVYGSGRATNAMSTQELVEGAQAYVAEGCRAVKLRIGSRRPAEDVARVRAVIDALGPAVTVMVDCNERYDLATAQWVGRALDELAVAWMEEPLRSDDIVGHARLASRIATPVAAGEHLQGRHEFADYLQAGALAVAQPDAPLTGGVTEFLRIGVLADVHSAAVSPHFLPELHVHLAAATPTSSWVEHFPLIDDLLSETLAPVDGVLRPPERPGHGMVWDAEAMQRFAAT